ncbi:GGDEF domain-containing protein [Halomonas dongshanensis]|uniref:diguanylate cyclase n=1 Tax=Halomonas dongshanensis TaxID=2890835 RepID=A0ABT2EC11_9GAMM|nr:GGDEF domain-containing protein [Halomonas dongshanensis]MCS2609116.1 GGDEF domain-containing protein [Halomonas dongshanensis]
MAFDPATMLSLTLAIAAAAALYLLLEWRSVKEFALLYWAAGFATVFVGSSLSLLRASGHLFIGIWLANGLLVLAHWLFLLGVIRFVGERLPTLWWCWIALWCAMLALPFDPAGTKIYLIVNSLIVGLLSLRASAALKLAPDVATLGTQQLRYVLMIHGLFYVAKGTITLLPGTLIDLTVFQGTIIRVSLVEGVMAILLIALSMTGTVRYRRERQIEHLAERDPLTVLLNRRGFEARAARRLAEVSPSAPGALILVDIDHFKQVNDLHGHAAGDRLLVTLADLARQMLPPGSLEARLGGDEFAFLINDTSAEELSHIGETLRQRFQLAATAFAAPQTASLSLGVILFDTPPSSLDILIDQSDRALYDAKRRGRNRMTVL